MFGLQGERVDSRVVHDYDEDDDGGELELRIENCRDRKNLKLRKSLSPLKRF